MVQINHKVINNLFQEKNPWNEKPSTYWCYPLIHMLQIRVVSKNGGLYIIHFRLINKSKNLSHRESIESFVVLINVWSSFKIITIILPTVRHPVEYIQTYSTIWFYSYDNHSWNSMAVIGSETGYWRSCPAWIGIDAKQWNGAAYMEYVIRD